MVNNKIIILVGNETDKKIQLLKMMQMKYKFLIPRRYTNDKTYLKYSSTYQIISKDYMEQSIKQLSPFAIKSFNLNKTGISGLNARDIAQFFANIYNGYGKGIIFNITINELSYYQKYYPKAITIGFGSKNDRNFKTLESLYDIEIDENSELNDELLIRIMDAFFHKDYVLTLKK